jgi:hypothetical protein
VTLDQLVEAIDQLLRERGLTSAVTSRRWEAGGANRYAIVRNTDHGTRHLRVTELGAADPPWEFSVLGGVHGSPDPKENFDGRRGGTGPYVLEVVRRFLIDLGRWDEILSEEVEQGRAARDRDGALPLATLMEQIDERVRAAGAAGAITIERSRPTGERASFTRVMGDGRRFLRVDELLGADRPCDFDVWGGVVGSLDRRDDFNRHTGGGPALVLDIVQGWLLDLVEWEKLPLPPPAEPSA